MSKRIVDSPDQHGWEEVDGKWIWSGTSTSAGKWEDGPDDSIYYDEGNVGVGTDDPSRKFTAVSTQSVVGRFESTGSIGGQIGFSDANTSTPSNPTGDAIDIRIGSIGDDFSVFTGNTQRLTVDDTGNVGVGTDSPTTLLEVRGSNEVATFRGVGSQLIKVNFSQDPSTAEIDVRNAADFLISKQGAPALTIDNNTNATFSGTVTSTAPNGTVAINPTDQGANDGHIRFRSGSGSWFNIGKLSSGNAFQINSGANFEDPANGGLTIEADGNATFSGTVTVESTINSKHIVPVTADTYSLGSNARPFLNVNANDGFFSGTVNANSVDAVRVYRQASGGCGMQFQTSSEIVPTKNDGQPDTTGAVGLGSATYRFKDAHFIGTVTAPHFDGNVVRSSHIIQDGSPVIDAKGLITTLSTLRNATKDETTLEGMRDALSDAIGGLIQNLEHEISTMPAPDPEVSTMPAEESE